MHGTLRWMAPEVILPSQSDGRLTQASDVYAFAMTMIEVSSYNSQDC